ncbi:MAG: hypothetical protein IT204_22475 [Fimbriimonadaceae bacterium]|nr:hypothetical protein [Fimbriimonadaceae bacterium]
MTEQELAQLVEATVQAVLAQLQPPAPRGPRVRVLVSDTDHGLDLVLAGLKPLASRWRLEYVLTSGETAQVTPAYVRERGGAATVQTEVDAGCPRAFAKGADLVLAATLDRATALRVALTMPERWGERFLFDALRRGKPVVLATDGLFLEAPDATPQLRAALAEPVARLEVFGATVLPAAQLAAAAETALAGPPGYNAASNRALVTAAEVEAAGDELVLPAGALVTPLALDRARELGVILRRLPH